MVSARVGGQTGGWGKGSGEAADVAVVGLFRATKKEKKRVHRRNAGEKPMVATIIVAQMDGLKMSIAGDQGMMQWFSRRGGEHQTRKDLLACNRRRACVGEPFRFRGRPGSPPWLNGGRWGRRRSRRRRSLQRRRSSRARASRLSCTGRLPTKVQGRARRCSNHRLCGGFAQVSWPRSILEK